MPSTSNEPTMQLLDKGQDEDDGTTDDILQNQGPLSVFDLGMIRPPPPSNSGSMEVHKASCASLSSYSSSDCEPTTCRHYDDLDNEDSNSSGFTFGNCISSSETREELDLKTQRRHDHNKISFQTFRLQYLVAFTAIMLADGLQGTHLYVLYEGYGYSVASLYALGFVSGAITSVFTGALVDRIGRKKAVMAYCALEIFINYLEQFPILLFLVVSRMIGGITTNLLYTVFETWLVTEHRKRNYGEDKLGIILHDSNIVSNLAAIVSGYIAHCLATAFGPVGPFQGAVGFTFLALFIVTSLWSENYGSTSSENNSSMKEHIVDAYETIVDDPRLSCLGLIHGLTEGSLQTFVFLWSPTLKSVSSSSIRPIIGLDENGEPAYGLVFAAFMLFGVIGGLIEPKLRSVVHKITSSCNSTGERESTDDSDDGTFTVNSLCAGSYLLSAFLLVVPCIVHNENPYAFIVILSSFVLYELLVGVFVPSQGIIRSIYIPNESMCSIMTMLRLITNIAVSIGVIMTIYVPTKVLFGALSSMMALASILQFSLLPAKNIVPWKVKRD